MESLGLLFEVFSRERRRYALYALEGAGGPVDVEALAEQIRRWEDDDTEVSAEEYDDVVLSLRHTHLPKASRVEHVEYDREEGEVSISGNPTELEIILAVGEAVEQPEAEERFDPDTVTPEEFLTRFAATRLTSD